jgi:alkylated DNA repair dioxygenase AlkB
VAVVQGSLLDQAPSSLPGDLERGLTRTVLDQGAWIDVRPAWVSRPDLAFEALHRAVEWRAERRRMYDRVVDVPRLHRFYDAGEDLPHPVCAELREALNRHYGDEAGWPLVTLGAALYRDGRDSVAFHGDTIGRGAREDTLVAIVSLGAPRRFLLRPRGGGRSLRLVAGPGDLLVMGGTCQRTWEHAVPKTARPCGPRLSLQFRPAGVR